MNTYQFLFNFVIILFSTKVLGLITKRFRMPQVAGMLLAGLLLGPAVFNVIEHTGFIQNTAKSA